MQSPHLATNASTIPESEKKKEACSKGSVKKPGTHLLIKFIKFKLWKSQL